MSSSIYAMLKQSKTTSSIKRYSIMIALPYSIPSSLSTVVMLRLLSSDLVWTKSPSVHHSQNQGSVRFNQQCWSDLFDYLPRDRGLFKGSRKKKFFNGIAIKKVVKERPSREKNFSWT